VSTVLVTGASGPLGTRVCALLDADPTVERVLRLDSLEVTPAGRDLKALVEGVDTVIHLGSTLGPELDGTGAAGVDVDGSQKLLEAAGSGGTSTIVVLSTAMVYGAWPNNPVPLTEDAALRPNPELAFAVRKAEVERLAAEWRSEHPGATVAILRPTIALAEELTGWMAWSLWGSGGVQPEDLEPPAQFVHLDDLAAAVDLARRRRLDGVYNVAPDGWIGAEQLRALAGPRARLRLPEPLASRVAAMRWRLGLTPTPPAVLPFTVHPWVVANDRLRAAGWEPTYSNEEAFVVGSAPGPLESLSSRHRQELALGAVAVGVAALVGGAIALALRWRRRRADLR
jgi:nucleoside-diphosphate-sugar epimerase